MYRGLKNNNNGKYASETDIYPHMPILYVHSNYYKQERETIVVVSRRFKTCAKLRLTTFILLGLRSIYDTMSRTVKQVGTI